MRTRSMFVEVTNRAERLQALRRAGNKRNRQKTKQGQLNSIRRLKQEIKQTKDETENQDEKADNGVNASGAQLIGNTKIQENKKE